MKKIKDQQKEKEAKKTEDKCKGHNCCGDSPKFRFNTGGVRGLY